MRHAHHYLLHDMHGYSCIQLIQKLSQTFENFKLRRAKMSKNLES